MSFRAWPCVALVCGVLVAPLACANEQVFTIPTRPGVTDSYLLVTTDAAPKSVVALSFVGGVGAIHLARRAQHMPLKFGPDTNFLVRIRDQLVNADIADVIIDSPSDHEDRGMDDAFRESPEHAADVGAVIADVKKRYPNAKVFLIGTSRGTISGAAMGVALHDSIAGVILTSTVTHWDKMGPALSQFDFATLKVPTLLIHHVDDGCFTSPYSGASALSKQFPLVSVKGGNPPQSGPCDPLAQHGYFGLDAPVVAVMQQFMLGQPYARSIP